jgi:NADH-quinone oxidoreductase subunit M
VIPVVVLNSFIFLPLVAAVVLALLPKSARGGAAVTVGVIHFALGMYLWLGNVSARVVVDWLPALGVKYAVSLTGASLLLALVTAFMVPIGLYYLTTRDDGKLGGFNSLALAMTTGLIGIFAARDLILFYVFFEATLIPSLFLLGRYGRAARVPAMTTMALYTVISGLLMLAAIIGTKLLSGAGSFLLEDLQKTVPTLPIGTQTWLFLGFLAAFAVKTPLFPLHNWLPEFHAQNHPSGVADLMGTLYKVGGYGLFAFAIPLFPQVARNLQVPLMLAAAFTALYGAWIAYSSRDFKRLLAYSGLSHMGLVALGVFSLNPIGMSGAMYLLAFQGVYSSALFLIVGMLERRFVEVLHTDESREKSLDEAMTIGRVRGLASSAPAFAGVALTVWFASIGVPGLAGFIGEFSVLLGAYQAQPWMAALAVVTVIASAAFALTAYQRTWYEEATATVPDVRPREWLVLAPVIAVIVIFGVYSSPALKLIDSNIQQLTRDGVFRVVSAEVQR